MRIGVLLAAASLYAAPAAAQEVLPYPAVPEADDGGGMEPQVRPMPETLRPAAGTEITLGAATWDGRFGGRTGNTISAVLLNVRQRLGPLRIDATLPWMRIRSQSTIFTGINGTPLVVGPSIPMTRPRRQGLGDLTLGASWLAAAQDAAGLDIDLSARVKLPTAADSTQLSTGKTDYAFGVEVARTMGAVTPVARINYRVFGDPTGWTIRDGIATSVGASVALPGQGIFLLSYDYAERTSRFIRPAHEIVGGASAPIGDRFRLTAYASGGLSSGAAAFSTGVSLTLALSNARR